MDFTFELTKYDQFDVLIKKYLLLVEYIKLLLLIGNETNETYFE